MMMRGGRGRGRGREMTMPAWMTQGGKGGAAPSAGGDGHVPGYGASGHSNGSSAPPAARPGGAGGSSNAYANYNYGGGGAAAARPGGMGGMLMPPQMQQQGGGAAAAAAVPTGPTSAARPDRSRSRSGSRDRHRRHRSSSRRHRSSRHRSRSGSRHRSSRHRRRHRHKDSDGDDDAASGDDSKKKKRSSRSKRHRSSRSRSRSRSRSPHRSSRRRRARKKSNFDVAPAEAAAAAAAAAAAGGVGSILNPSVIAGLVMAQAPAMAAAGGAGGGAGAMMNPMMNAMMMGGAGGRAGGAGVLTRMPGAPQVDQSTRHCRRLYVGGLSGNVTEQDLSQFFTDTMNKALHMNKNDHVITVYLNLPRRFAFVEFRTPELAAAGLQLDGLPYNGMVLRVRRPNDFKPHLVPAPSEPPLPAMDLKSVGVLSNQVPDSKGKCFVGGIPYEMDEAQVRQLLESFGPLKALHLVRDPGSVTSKGYGFCEWQDESITDKACEGLNGLPVGDKTLTVRRALPQGQVQPPAPGGGMGLLNAGGAPAVPMTLATLPPFVPKKPPTPVLILMNMVTADDVANESEYNEILEDIRGECGNYGTVKAIVIPREGPGIGKVFVEYADAMSAGSAALALAGRTFDGRVVAAEFMAVEDFAARKFD